MKFFHLSDLHIGLKLINRDLHDDQRHVLQQVIDYAAEELPDAVVIAGDVYDKAIPSAEAVELFDWFITELNHAAADAAIMIISGNHDSAQRVNVFRNVLGRQHIYMIGNPPEKNTDFIEQVHLEDAYGRVNFYLLPFVKPSYIKEIVGTQENGNNLSYNDSIHELIKREQIDMSERNVLVSHQFYLPEGHHAEDMERMESEIVMVGNIDSVKGDILKQFDYAALGHIHKPTQIGDEFHRYCGTPLACSVSEAGQDKGIVMVEMNEKGSISTKVLSLYPLHRVRIIEGTMEEVLKQGCSDYVQIRLREDAHQNTVNYQTRIRAVFENCLNIEMEQNWKPNLKKSGTDREVMSAYDLCMSFLGDTIPEEEKEILRQVINQNQGG